MKQHYVVTRGNAVWISKGDDWNGEWESTSTTAPSNDGTPHHGAASHGLSSAGGEHGATSPEDSPNVRHFLSTRMPTKGSELSRSDTASLGPDQEEPAETPSTEPAETPNAEAEDATAANTAAPDQEAHQGPVGPADSFRLDKHGNPISPEALYMRFYRKLRSFLIYIKTNLIDS